MDVKILSDAMYAVLNLEGIEIAQKPIPDDLKSLSDTKLRLALRDLELMPPIEVAEPLPPGKIPERVPYHEHPEALTRLPAHDHPLAEHSHPHEHERALVTEAILEKKVGDVDRFVARVQDEFRSHNHQPTPHEHAHTHEDILESQAKTQEIVSGLALQVGDATRSHSHAEIQQSLSEVRAATEATSAYARTHSHPHEHLDLVGRIDEEKAARVADRDHTHPFPAHIHDLPKHEHMEITDLESVLRKEIAGKLGEIPVHDHPELINGLRINVDAQQRQLDSHSHPHVHPDFLNEVMTLRQQFAEVREHGHSDLANALDLLGRKLEIESQHVHDPIPQEAFVHQHADLHERLNQISAEQTNLRNLLSQFSDQIANLNIGLTTAIQNAVEALQPKGDYVTQEKLDALTKRKGEYIVLSTQDVNGKRRHVMEEV